MRRPRSWGCSRLFPGAPPLVRHIPYNGRSALVDRDVPYGNPLLATGTVFLERFYLYGEGTRQLIKDRSYAVPYPYGI